MPRLSLLALGTFALASILAPGCTVGGGRPDSGGTQPGEDGGMLRPDTHVAMTGDLVIAPLDYEATIMGAPVEIDYTAMQLQDDGTFADVTSMVTWSAASLGSFTGSHFTSVTDRGGHTSIIASLGARRATTGLTLHLNRDILGPGAPTDAPTRFEGTDDPANAPSIVYPDDGAMIPPNLEHFELHFMPNGSNLFRLEVTTSAVVLRVYFDCGEAVSGGCIFAPDHDTWAAISDAARGETATYRLTGTDSAGRIGSAATRSLQVAQEDITGGVYYWNAAGGAIMRYEFGVPGAVEERFLGVAQTGAGTMCVGCHTLSRDGTHIAVGTGIPTSTLQIFDVASRNRLLRRPMMGGGFPQQPNFYSFSPDNAQLVVSAARGLNIMDPTTGTITQMGITSGVSSMPDWSPDGNHIVYVSVSGGPAIEAPAVTSGSIARVDLSGGTWTAGPVLAAADGGNNYHPTYSPDGNWVVYNRSPSNIGSMGASDSSMGAGDCVTDAEMWFVAADGSGVATQLSGIGPADRPADGVCASWPKFDPTVYHDHGHDLFWIAYATARGYGLRYGDQARFQIWMAAFDPTRAAAGMQPIHPAIRLPFQNIESGNHIAQWVTHIERQGCTGNQDCGGEFCYMGRCYEQVPVF
ncbi:MAG: hypothetical protein U0234_29565 [Sandaracinus sp.]